MSKIKVNYESVREYVNELNELNNRVNDTIDSINNLAASMQNERAWEGKASDYFKTQLNKVCENYKSMSKEIDNTILYMAKCSDGYEAIEDHIKKLIMEKNNLDNLDITDSKYYGGV